MRSVKCLSESTFLVWVSLWLSPRSQIGAVPPAFSLHIMENSNLETGCQRSDASWEAAASASTACACPRPRGASTLGACSPHYTPGCQTECQERARSDAHARALPRTPKRSRADPQQPEPDWLTRCLCQGFSFAPWGSISAGVANCCSVGSTSTSFLFLAFFPPKASYAQIEGVVLSQNFNVFDAGWFQAIIYLFRDYWFLLILSEGPQSQSGAILARGVGKSWGGNSHTCCPERPLHTKMLFKF